MIQLNYPLLSRAGIITSFEKDVVKKQEPSGNKARSLLSNFKTKLKKLYFENLDIATPDEEILNALANDPRFTSAYPDLGEILQHIFSFEDGADKADMLSQLKEIQVVPHLENTTRDSWTRLNTELGYFSDDPELFALYNELTNACRAMIILVEQNNPDGNLAYTYAYKLMALFVDQNNPPVSGFEEISKKTEQLLKRVSSKINTTPYHDVLLNRVKLPVAHHVGDIPGWRNFIHTNPNNTVAALQYFAMAPEIEAVMKNRGETHWVPRDLAEAKSIAAQCHYARGSRNPELSIVSRQYNIPEDGDECSFNKCLDYLETISWPIKTQDTLPHPEIKGEGDAAGYYWVKLPTNDLRALFLGMLTGCCQSIGGHSEKCVKDAVSLQYNGLYVLLKPTSAKASSPFLPDQSINQL